MNYLKRNIKLAYKSVVFHFKQYLCFYVALFIIQFLFGLIVMSTVNTNHMRKQEITEKYDYHVCIAGLNEQQYKYLADEQYAATAREHEKLTLLRYETRYVGEYLRYDVYFLYENDFGDSPQSIHSWFNENALKNIRSKSYANNFDVNFSPLYTMDNTIGAQIGECAVLLGILFVVGITVLLLLYNIRINHFKFTYGIYMSYGADFKKLFETSFWEMFVIQLLTLLPATALATLTNWFFYLFSGFSYFFSPYMMLLALPYTGFAAFLAVYIPIKRAAVKPPLELLLAEDNSNLVVSPRLSFNMFGRRFPSSYNFFSAVRFRKYNLQVVCSAVLFSALFICAVFGSGVYSHTEDKLMPEYRVSFNQHKEKVKETVTEEKDVTDAYKKAPADVKDTYHIGLNTGKYVIRLEDGTEGGLADLVAGKGGKIYEVITKEVEKEIYVGDTYTPEKGEELLALPGVTNIYKECYKKATDNATYLYMDPDKVIGDDGMLIYDSGYGLRAYTQDASYYAADKEIVDYLVDNYKVTGDPYKVLSTFDKYETPIHYVIVTNSRNNVDTLSLKPGDTIILETISEVKINTNEPMTGKQLLQYVIDNGAIDIDRSYRFEVCAVVENISTSANYPLFISGDDYKLVTNDTPEYKEVMVYTDNNITKEKLEVLTADIRSWAKGYTDTSVTPLNALEERNAQRAECRLPLLIASSVTLLMLAPLFWFFSQTMFYKKREKEMELLRAMGAIESEMRGMFVRDGLIYAGLGALLTSVFGGAGVVVIYRLSLKMFAVTGNYFAPRFELEFPWIALATGILISVLCAFASSYIPYILDKKRTVKRITTFRSGDDD